MLSWYSGATCAGYGELNSARFRSIANLDFTSVLDVGSGPCRLLSWLEASGRPHQYEAMDIREDALIHCRCKTHRTLPKDKTYDLVCLFGTCGFVGDKTEQYQKSLFASLLWECIPLSKKYLVFSGIRDTVNCPYLVRYTEDEFMELVGSLPVNFTIDTRSDPAEWIAICETQK